MQASHIKEALQYRQDWEDTFNAITDMITIHDMEFNIIYANRAAKESLGLPLSGSGEKKCYKYYHGTDFPPARCPSCKCLTTHEPATYEMFEPNLNRFLEIRTMPRLDHNNRLLGLIHIVRDITDRKRAVEERARLETQLLHSQKLQTVGTLTGGAVHDFNNYLTAILGYSELLQIDMEQCDPASAFSIMQIRDAAEKAANLTRDLLAFSRKKTITPQLLNINDVVKQAKKLLKILISKKIELRTMLAGDDLKVMADSCQIEQILMNLAINARDAMPDGGTLAIKTGAVELDDKFSEDHGYGKHGRYILISVSDNGVGMDGDTVKRIFEPFFTTKEAGKGTGLGLAIAYGIIKQYGGYIDVNSKIGEGTTFKIYLPANSAKVEKTGPPMSAVHPGRAGTVLVLERNTNVRGFMADVLADGGYEVLEANNAENAIAQVSGNKDNINVLIMDRTLRKKNGRDAYEEIKKINPGIKVLFTDDNYNEVTEKGAGLIPKPFLPIELLNAVIEVQGK